jgi:hypothetical protein
MKSILLTLALLASTLHAADVVVVVSATSVTVNGVHAGKPADTIRNRPELASLIQFALEKRESEQAATLAAAQAELASALARRAALVTLAKEKLAQLPADAQVILSNVLYQAELPDILVRRAAAQAEFAAAQRKFDEANK